MTELNGSAFAVSPLTYQLARDHPAHAIEVARGQPQVVVALAGDRRVPLVLLAGPSVTVTGP